MATKKRLAEQVMRIVSGGHLKPDRTIDIREVMLYIDQLRDKAAKLAAYEAQKMGNHSMDQSWLSFQENITVQAAGANGLEYIDLPVKILALPGGLGLYQVSPVDDMTDAFKIIFAGQQGLLAGTQALAHTGNTYCWAVGDTVYLINNGEVAVSALVVASSDSIAESADYPVPPEVEDDIIKEAVQMFGVMQQIPHDEREDGQK